MHDERSSSAIVFQRPAVLSESMHGGIEGDLYDELYQGFCHGNSTTEQVMSEATNPCGIGAAVEIVTAGPCRLDASCLSIFTASLFLQISNSDLRARYGIRIVSVV